MSGYYQIDAPCKHCGGALDHIAGGYVHRTVVTSPNGHDFYHSVQCYDGKGSHATPDWKAAQ